MTWFVKVCMACLCKLVSAVFNLSEKLISFIKERLLRELFEVSYYFSNLENSTGIPSLKKIEYLEVLINIQIPFLSQIKEGNKRSFFFTT